jgi:hypothetical protein
MRSARSCGDDVALCWRSCDYFVSRCGRLLFARQQISIIGSAIRKYFLDVALLWIPNSDPKLCPLTVSVGAEPPSVVRCGARGLCSFRRNVRDFLVPRERANPTPSIGQVKPTIPIMPSTTARHDQMRRRPETPRPAYGTRKRGTQFLGSEMRHDQIPLPLFPRFVPQLNALQRIVGRFVALVVPLRLYHSFGIEELLP